MATVAANPAGSFLYVTEFQNTGSGQYYVAEFSIDHSSGGLTHTTTIQVANSGLGIKVDPTGSVLALGGNSVSVPNYANPTVALYKIAGDGSLTPGGAPMSVVGQQVQDLLFDASGQDLFVLSNQANPAPPGSSLQSFRVNDSTGSLMLVQSIPLSIGATQLAVVNSKYLYVSLANGIAGYSIQADGSLTPITGTPFGTSVAAYGLAASPSGSMVYASDISQKEISWFSVSATGALTLVGSTASSSIIPAAGIPNMVVDRSGKYLYSTACDPKSPPPGCSPVLWGGTIGGEGAVSPMNGTPFPVPVSQFDLAY
jgi:6-phosphogluconolactonase (cycloisomerase 2 family)